ncbi:MAG: hypothetical protein GXO83_12180 [Chlorobi bacterium]|nr:hypothetical protein [Chlorobiota bacterium]
MNLSGNKTITSIIIEMFSVIFAVLLALFAKDYHDKVQTKHEMIGVIKNIKTEITRNRDSLSLSVQAHERLLDTLGTYYSSKFDFTDIKLGFADMFKKAEFKLVMPPITTVTWETAKYSGIVKEFPFRLLSEITKMIFIQESINDVLKELKGNIYTKDIFEPKETKKEFLIIMLTIEDIIKKEKLLIDSYNDVIREIDAEIGK